MARDDRIIELEPPRRAKRTSKVFFDVRGKGVRIRQPFMNDSHGGGRLEDVPGFDRTRAVVQGLPFATLLRPPPPLDGPAAHQGFEVGFGVGDRLIAVPDAALLPFRSIAYLDMAYTDGSRGVGTGWFASANTLVTAAHCFFNPDRKVQVSRVNAIPGFSNGLQPFQQHNAPRIFFPKEWERSVRAGNPDPLFDYALAYFDDEVGQTVSWFGMAAPPDSALDDLLLNISGYAQFPGPVVQYYDGGRLLTFDANFLYHRFDTERGMSGAPIIVRRNERRYVIGIHNYGDSIRNRARRIDDALFDELSGRLQ